MTAMKALSDRMDLIKRAQEDCLENGVVKTCCRYRYQMLEDERIKLQESLDWMKSSRMYKEEKPKQLKKKRWFQW